MRRLTRREYDATVFDLLGEDRALARQFVAEASQFDNELFVTIGQALGLSDFTTFGDPQFVDGPIAALLT